jgi:hypothetical protein
LLGDVADDTDVIYGLRWLQQERVLDGVSIWPAWVTRFDDRQISLRDTIVRRGRGVQFYWIRGRTRWPEEDFRDQTLVIAANCFTTLTHTLLR